MSASTPFSKIEKMLKECAPGSDIRLANHSRVIHFGGKVYRSFPKSDTVEHGHVRKMVRFLGIDTACASRHLPGVIKGITTPVAEPVPPTGEVSTTKLPTAKKAAKKSPRKR